MGDGPIRAVTFDAAGTLITVTRPVGETYAELARAHAPDIDGEAIPGRFRAAFAAMPPMAFPDAPRGDIARLEREWWRDLVRRVVCPERPFEGFDHYFDDLFEHYAKGGAWRAYAEVRSTLTTLRDQGLALAVVSNFDSRLENILRALELDEFFDEIVYSTDAGAAKPERAIFELALERLGVEAGATLHVGDRRDADLEGARAAGLGAVLVDRGLEETAPTPSDTVRTLAEVTGLVAPPGDG